MDGSQKLPQRLLQPALDRLRQGETPARIALVVAAWMRFLLQRDERGRPYEISDPLAGRLITLATGAEGSAEALAAALFGVQEVFDPALTRHSGFRDGGCSPSGVACSAQGVPADLGHYNGRRLHERRLEADGSVSPAMLRPGRDRVMHRHHRRVVRLLHLCDCLGAGL